MDLAIDDARLSDAARAVLKLPGLFKRAKISALKSTGYMIRGVLRSYIEKGGNGSWPELHPVSKFFSRKYGVKAHEWRRARRSLGPLYWLGKHARYSVAEDEAVIGFGKSHGDKDRGARRNLDVTMDPFIMAVVKRAEHGEKTQVTQNMRRFFGATRYSNNRFQEAGGTFFPIRASTKTLETEKRPIFDPVMALIERRIPWHFEDRFFKAVTRYQTGAENKSWL